MIERYRVGYMDRIRKVYYESKSEVYSGVDNKKSFYSITDSLLLRWRLKFRQCRRLEYKAVDNG